MRRLLLIFAFLLLPSFLWAAPAPIAIVKKGSFAKGTTVYGPYTLPFMPNFSFVADVDSQPGLDWTAVIEISIDGGNQWKKIMNCHLTGEPIPSGKGPTGCSTNGIGIPAGALGRATVTANQDCKLGFTIL